MESPEEWKSTPISTPLHPSKPLPDQPPNLSPEELREWHEQVAQARLAGQQERSNRFIDELVSSNLDTRLYFSSLRFLGASHTRSSFLSALVDPLINSQEQHTLQSLLLLSQQIKVALAPFDIFDRIDVSLQEAQSVLAKDGAVDLVVGVKEKSRWYLRSGTEVGQGEGSASLTGKVRNVFGGAESLSVTTSVGTKTRSAYEVIFSSPLFASPTTSASAMLFAADRDNTAFASHRENINGGRLSVTMRSLFGGHTFSYENLYRSIGSLTPTASLSIREAANPSFKSALSHTFVRDTRLSPFLSPVGSLIKSTQELAGCGLGGRANHLKLTTETHVTRHIAQGFWTSFTTRSGFLLPLGPSGSLLPDRFFLGGPTSVRGFKNNGMGSRDGEDSLGGDLTWSAGLSVIGPLPLRPEWPLKLQGFVNAGKLTAVDKSKSVQENLSSLTSKPSISVGLGLIYNFSPIRVELNFSVPLTSSRSEGLARGLGLGMGIDFL